MIFVTVGTSVKPFDRLVKMVDALKAEGVIQEEVYIQLGEGMYLPRHCKFSRFVPFDEMIKYFNESRITITHGAPASVILGLRSGKMPIVAPRQLRLNEHVTDHQVYFTRELEARGKIIAVYDVAELGQAIAQFDAQLHWQSGRHQGIQVSANPNYTRKLDEVAARI